MPLLRTVRVNLSRPWETDEPLNSWVFSELGDERGDDLDDLSMLLSGQLRTCSKTFCTFPIGPAACEWLRLCVDEEGFDADERGRHLGQDGGARWLAAPFPERDVALRHAQKAGELGLGEAGSLAQREQLYTAHVEQWKVRQAERVTAGEVAPTTINGWLAIIKAARRQLGLTHDPMDGVENLDTSEHSPYSEEEPNSLEPNEVGPFVAKFRELHPQHFGMFYLGLVTGLRPSTLRPLRRRGAEADVQWDQGRILVRRSHSLGDEVMRTTKQKRRYAIDLPKEVMDVLAWHVDTQLETDDQKDSDLLFPSITGGFRTPRILNSPMADVARELKLKKRITPKALRRTFNDLARAAEVNDFVTRSISGHLTEQMQRHYSTANASEQRDALAKVIRLFDAPTPATRTATGRGGEHGGEHTAPGGVQSKTG